MLSMK
jgi:hypothetical protein